MHRQKCNYVTEKNIIIHKLEYVGDSYHDILFVHRLLASLLGLNNNNPTKIEGIGSRNTIKVPSIKVTFEIKQSKTNVIKRLKYLKYIDDEFKKLV